MEQKNDSQPFLSEAFFFFVDSLFFCVFPSERRTFIQPALLVNYSVLFVMLFDSMGSFLKLLKVEGGREMRRCGGKQTVGGDGCLKEVSDCSLAAELKQQTV